MSNEHLNWTTINSISEQKVLYCFTYAYLHLVFTVGVRFVFRYFTAQIIVIYYNVWSELDDYT